MTELLVLIVAALAVIAAATVVGPRPGIAAPLVLVAIGVVASFLPVFRDTHIEPEWILEGVLPPLLYSSAVSMPAMNFRREFGAISGLSVLLVIGSALLLGLFFMLVIPDLGFARGVALGAIVSPTDAVATSARPRGRGVPDMGVQIKAIVMNVEQDHAGSLTAVLIAAAALALTVLVRAAYVAPLLGFLRARSRHGAEMQERTWTRRRSPSNFAARWLPDISSRINRIQFEKRSTEL